MHIFKRFFLLSALILSISIPLITFTHYVETTPLILSDVPQDILITHNATTAKTFTNYLPNVLWSVYLIGVCLFGFKFFRNLYQLNYKIKFNPKQRYNKFTHVLLKDLIIPHTFFNYIFFNKTKFEANEIPEEVFWHEQTHAEQKHSIDVLFLEALQVLFWFNPLIYAIKHAIKLNHEFLADQGVLQRGIKTNRYQEIILAFSSNAVQPQLANAINYSLIKKRFTVMKTQTTKQGIWLRSIILLPLLAIMLYSFSDSKVVEKNAISKTSITNHTARSIDIEVFNNGAYKIDGIKATKETFISVINQLHQDITPEIRNQIINIHVNNGKTVSDEDVWFIYNAVINYGFHRIVTYNQEIIREKGNKPFAIENTNKQEYSKEIIEQQKATKAQIKEYNKSAKKYNNMSKDEMYVKKSDMERLKYLYSLMSDAQKKDAEPFPNIPPPPPAPKAPRVIEAEEVLPPPPPPIPANATPEQKAKYKKVITEYAKKYPKSVTRYKSKSGELIEEVEVPVAVLPPPPPPPPMPDNATPEQKRKHKENLKKYELAVEKSKQMQAKVNAMSKKEIAMLKKQKEAYAARQTMLKREELAYKEARVEKMKTERAKLREVKEQYAAQRKASQEVKLAKVAEMKVRQEKLKKEKMQRVVERQSISEERREKLAKEKLKHVEERKVLAEQKREYAIAAKLKRQEKSLARRENNIPPPPPPKSPLDHVIEMAKKGAIFYLEGKEVSSDKAIEAIKKNKSLNIETKSVNSKQPKVYITKKPIVIDN